MYDKPKTTKKNLKTLRKVLKAKQNRDNYVIQLETWVKSKEFNSPVNKRLLATLLPSKQGKAVMVHQYFISVKSLEKLLKWAKENEV